MVRGQGNSFLPAGENNWLLSVHHLSPRSFLLPPSLVSSVGRGCEGVTSVYCSVPSTHIVSLLPPPSLLSASEGYFLLSFIKLPPLTLSFFSFFTFLFPIAASFLTFSLRSLVISLPSLFLPFSACPSVPHHSYHPGFSLTSSFYQMLFIFIHFYLSPSLVTRPHPTLCSSPSDPRRL